jgi:hypothetical protein
MFEQIVAVGRVMLVTRPSRPTNESRLNFELANNSSSELSRDICCNWIPEAINFPRPARVVAKTQAGALARNIASNF